MDQSTERPKLIDVRRAANRLNCTPSHIYNLIKEGRLKAIRIGERAGIRIEEKCIEEFLSSRVIDPDEYHQ